MKRWQYYLVLATIILFSVLSHAQGTIPAVYAQGTCTPSLTLGGGNTGITYSDRSCFWTKIGNRIIVDVFVFLTSKGSSTGTALITLDTVPNAASNSNQFSTCAAKFTNVSAGTGAPIAFVNHGTKDIFLQALSSGTTASIADTNLTNTFATTITCSYQF